MLDGYRVGADRNWREVEVAVAIGLRRAFDSGRVAGKVDGRVWNSLLLAVDNGSNDGSGIHLGEGGRRDKDKDR